MGYNSGSLDIYLRVDNHLDERTTRDREAEESLKMEIQALIDSDPNYARIAPLGVSGGTR